MTSTAAIADKLTALAGKGITCTPSINGKLLVQPPSLLTGEDRAWLRDHARDVMAHFASNEEWNLETAVRLMHGADLAVAESGVSGRHPDIQSVVTVVYAAFTATDLRRVHLACEALRATVRRLAKPCNQPVQTGETRRGLLLV